MVALESTDPTPTLRPGDARTWFPSPGQVLGSFFRRRDHSDDVLGFPELFRGAAWSFRLHGESNPRPPPTVWPEAL